MLLHGRVSQMITSLLRVSYVRYTVHKKTYPKKTEGKWVWVDGSDSNGYENWKGDLPGENTRKNFMGLRLHRDNYWETGKEDKTWVIALVCSGPSQPVPSPTQIPTKQPSIFPTLLPSEPPTLAPLEGRYNDRSTLRLSHSPTLILTILTKN